MDCYIWSSPAIDGRKLYIGGYDKIFYKLDILTGAIELTYNAGGVIKSTPCVVNNKVYFGTAGNKMICLDL